MKKIHYNKELTPLKPFWHVAASVAFCLLLLGPVAGFGQAVTMEETSGDSADVIHYTPDQDWDFFDSDELLKMKLEFDFKEFTRGKRNPEYQKAVLKIFLTDSDSVAHDIRLRPRGIMRLDHCHFPPIKFNFKKSDSTSIYVGDETTMKLVTHCRNYGDYEEWLLKEFLVYRMYNVLTDMSFKVRLVEMQYIDTGKKEKNYSKYAFLIEHKRDMAIRNDAIALGDVNLTQKMINKKQLALMGVFQYMIGNTDWSIQGPHNVKFVRKNDVSDLIPYAIPYDFDYSGMVHTQYSIPAEGTPIEVVTQRYYFVWCLPEDILNEVFELFLEKRNEIYAVVTDFPYLEERAKEKMTRYLDEFYDIMDSERKRKQYILDQCLDR
jgi:hypothetical protein